MRDGISASFRITMHVVRVAIYQDCTITAHNAVLSLVLIRLDEATFSVLGIVFFV